MYCLFLHLRGWIFIFSLCHLEVTTAKYLNDTPFCKRKARRKVPTAGVGQFIPGEARGGDCFSEQARGQVCIRCLDGIVAAQLQQQQRKDRTCLLAGA